jgi:hypothetical protein
LVGHTNLVGPNSLAGLIDLIDHISLVGFSLDGLVGIGVIVVCLGYVSIIRLGSYDIISLVGLLALLACQLVGSPAL